MQLLTTFNRLQRDCPGAAFIFAATVRNSYELMDKQGKAAFAKSAARELAVPSNGADWSMGHYALRFMRAVAADDPLGMRAMVAMIIRDEGEKYRDLTPSDFEPPTSPRLAAAIHPDCAADVIARIEEEHKEKALGDAAFLETRNSMLALFDIKGEVDSGALPQYAAQLNAIIPA